MVSICACDAYKDVDNNIIEGKIENCKVIFKGKNSILRVSPGFKAYGCGLVIIIENSCDITLGSYFQVGKESTLFFRAGCKVMIGEHASLGNRVNIYCRGIINIKDYFCMREYSELRVHGNLTFDSWVYLQHHVTIYVPRHSELNVGKDTGFSWYSKVFAGSGHSTFDTKHKIKLEEMVSQGTEKKRLLIGNHVWVGSGSTIHNEVSIADNSAVVSGSVLYSGHFPDHVMIAGNPAKVVARNIDWDRRPDISYEEFEAYRQTGKLQIERPSFYDEYIDSGIADNYYMPDDYYTKNI